MRNNQSTPGKRRHRAREFALQAMFQWSIDPMPVADLSRQFLEYYDFSTTDVKYFSSLIEGAIEHVVESDEYINSVIPRNVDQMSVLIKALLRLSVYELLHCPAVPFRVVINEAIDLQKSYGADEGRAFVNAVLDKLAPKLRPDEYQSIVRK